MTRDLLVYIDDKEEEAKAIGDLLEARFAGNYDVWSFTDPIRALNFVKEKKEKGKNAALVITDMFMPGYKGEELAAELHKIDSSLPVLGYSGHNEYENVEDPREFGLEKLLRKDSTNSEALCKEAETFLNERYNMTSEHIFITGATGYLGGMLVERLLEKTDSHLYLLVRDSKGTPFDRRVSVPEHYKDRVTFIKGDLSERGLGMSPQDHDVMRNLHGVEFWHLAATTDFELTHHDEIMRINVGGGENMIDYLTSLPAGTVKVVNTISTAYVAGTKAYPLVSSEAIERTARHKNGYELSKYRVEQMFRDSGLPYRIFRPSIIIGDSQTGESDDKTIYGVAAIFASVAKKLDRENYNDREKVLRIKADPNALKNIIAIDDVVDGMLQLREADTGLTEVFHLTNPKPVTIRDIFDPIGAYFGFKIEYLHDLDFGVEQQVNAYVPWEQIKFKPFEEMEKPEGFDRVDYLLNRFLSQFGCYMNTHDPVFGRERIGAVLPGFRPFEVTQDSLREHFYARFYERNDIPASGSK